MSLANLGVNFIVRQSKFTAFLIHLVFSSFVFLCVSLFIIQYWFPGALFFAAGGLVGIKIVAGINLVLGPVLTLVVFNRSKRWNELCRDLCFIVLIQGIGLVCGIWVVFNERPVVMVHVYDTFYALKCRDYDALGIDCPSESSPRFVYIEVPDEKIEFVNLHVKILLNGDLPLRARLELYKDIPAVMGDAEPLLRGIRNDDCVIVSFESAYEAGSICYKPESKKFSNFRV